MLKEEGDSLGIVLVGHGSRYPNHEKVIERLARSLRTKANHTIETTSLGFSKFGILDAVSSVAAKGARKILIFPLFAAPGAHTLRDIPHLLGLRTGETRRFVASEGREVEVVYLSPLLSNHRIMEFIAEEILQTTREFETYGRSSTSPAGEEIFGESMETIRDVAKEALGKFTARYTPLVERVIHATADPSIVEDLHIDEGAVEAALDAIKAGADIITDIRMVQAGIRQDKLRYFGSMVTNYLADKRTHLYAKTHKSTLTEASMSTAVEDGIDGDIIVIGDSPTATLYLATTIRELKLKPATIIATPVGFIKAAESKERIEELTIPSITIRGRRGGSTIAVAIINSIISML